VKVGREKEKNHQQQEGKKKRKEKGGNLKKKRSKKKAKSRIMTKQKSSLSRNLTEGGMEKPNRAKEKGALKGKTGFVTRPHRKRDPTSFRSPVVPRVKKIKTLRKPRLQKEEESPPKEGKTEKIS